MKVKGLKLLMAVILIMQTISFTSVFANASSQEPISVSQAKASATDTKVFVEGIVVGVGTELTTKELLIKDTENDTILAVRDIPYGTFPDYGYKKGDLINFYATVKFVTGDTNTYVYSNKHGKTYLEFSAEDNDTIDTTIVSHNNKVVYKFDNVITLSSQEDINDTINTGAKFPVYTYLKLSGDSYLKYNPEKTNIIVHKSSSATSSNKTHLTNNRAMMLTNATLKPNLGEDWMSYFGADSITTSYPGTKISKEFYALYIGTSDTKSYYQLVILDESWIYDPVFKITDLDENKTNVTVNVPTAGTYTVVFADYENDTLNNVSAATLTVADNKLGRNVVEVPASITLGTEDKIMLWDNLDSITPKCAPYIIN